MGLISFTVSLHYNLSPFDSPVSSGVNRIECPSRVEEKAKNCLEWLNHESDCLLPSRTNSHSFYNPISISMDKVAKIIRNPGMILFRIIHVFLSFSHSKSKWLQFLFTLLPKHIRLFVSLTLKKDQLIRSASGCIRSMILLSTCLIS